MAYTKYSLTPANNTATPPDGAPEGMLPSAVNDTMRDMMAQIRDCGDGIRDGTYTMTAPKITGGTITGAAFTGNTFTSPVISGGSINNTPIGGTTANSGAFTTLSASGATTFSGATVVSGSLTANTFSSSGATITGGSINSTAIGGSTAAAGKFTTLEATGVTTVQAGTVSAPAITTTGDTNTGIFFPAADTIAFTEGGVESMRIDSSGNVGIGTSSPAYRLDVRGSSSSNIDVVVGANTSTAVTDSKGVGFLLRGSDSSGTLKDAAAIRTLPTSDTYANTNLLFLNRAGDTLTERMRIDSSGNVGIGTTATTPANGKALIIYETTYPRLTLRNSTTGTGSSDGYGLVGVGNDLYVENAENGNMVFTTNNTERMRIDSSGNVVIGTTASLSSYKTTIQHTSGELLGLNASSGTLTRIAFGNADASFGSTQIIANSTALALITGSAERMRITSGGNLLVGATAVSTNANYFAMDVSSKTAYIGHNNGTTTGTSYVIFQYNGTGIADIAQNGTTAVSYNTTSDYRLKENIAPMTGALAKVSQLKPVTYNWKVDGSKGQGFIAHELQAVVPDAVTGEKDAVDSEGKPVYQGVDTSFLVATLTAAIQEQQAMIEELKQEVAALKAK